MKKNVFSILVLIVMITALLVSFAGCSKAPDEASAARIAELEAQNAALQEQITALTNELDSMKLCRTGLWMLPPGMTATAPPLRSLLLP